MKPSNPFFLCLHIPLLLSFGLQRGNICIDLNTSEIFLFFSDILNKQQSRGRKYYCLNLFISKSPSQNLPRTSFTIVIETKQFWRHVSISSLVAENKFVYSILVILFMAICFCFLITSTSSTQKLAETISSAKNLSKFASTMLTLLKNPIRTKT